MSPQCRLSSQLPPCQPAPPLLFPYFSCCCGQPKPQLSHMPCLLDVWTKLEGSEVKTNLLSESDPVRQDGWKCLPLWFPREERQKTNGVRLFSFFFFCSEVQEVNCRCCRTQATAPMFSASLTQWRTPSPPLQTNCNPQTFPLFSHHQLIPASAQHAQWHCWQLSWLAHTAMTQWVIVR